MPEPASDKGVFVGSGGFLVDRARALEKLRAIQLADAGDFSLPWIRCAVLSVASRIRPRTVRHPSPKRHSSTVSRGSPK